MADLNSMFSNGPSWNTQTSPIDYSENGTMGTSPWDIRTNLNNYDSVDWNKLGWDGPTTTTGGGSDESYPVVNPEFSSWLTSKGYTPGEMQPMEGSAARYVGVLNQNKTPVNGSTFFSNPSDNEFWTGAMLVGGLVSGAAATSAGFGSAGAGAISGATTGFGNSGTLQGALKGAAAGGAAGQFVPDVAGYAGVENPIAASAINGGARSATSTALQGGNGTAVGRSAVTGGALSGLNSLGTQNMDTYQPMQGNQSLINDINQSSSVPSMPSWYTQDIGNAAGPQSTYASDTSGLGISPNYNQPQENSFLDQIKQHLGIGNGRIGAGITGPQGVKYGDLAGGLMQIYAANRQRQMASQMMGSVTGNNGAYAQNLRSQLQARDAAAGRRSDVGGREVQLQSALAQLTANQAPMINNLQQQQLGGLVSGLQGLYTIGDRSGLFGGNSPQGNTPSGFTPNMRAPSSYIPTPTIRDSYASLDPSGGGIYRKQFPGMGQ